MKNLTVNLCDAYTKTETTHVTLIQMPNGTGKTTTMALLRYCLDGTAEEMDEDSILSFKPPNSSVSEGKFILELLLDGWFYVIELFFDYKNKKVFYYTTKVSEKKSGGKERGLNLPREIKSMLTEQFVKLFVFDGELAGNILKLGRDDAEGAITSLYHLDKLKEISSKVDMLFDQKIAELEKSNAKTSQGIKNLNTRLKEAEEIKRKLIAEAKKLHTEFDDLEKKKGECTNKIDEFRKTNKKLQDEHIKLTSELKDIEAKIKEDTKTILSDIYSPNNLTQATATKLKTLGKQMFVLKMPKNESIEFFRDLAESKECICGREILPQHKKIILSKSEGYLTSENVSVLNSVKTILRNLPEREKVEDKIKQLLTLKRQRKEIEVSLIKAKEKLEQLGGAEISEMEKKIRDLQSKQDERQEILTVMEEKGPNELKMLQEHFGTYRAAEHNIKLCEREIDDLKIKLSEATDTVDTKKRADLLKEILQNIETKALDKLKGHIKDKTNKTISKILKSQDIQISNMSRHLVISGRSAVSEGQKLTIAYAFISTLFSESTHRLSFIVDTPASPLDLEVRREVARNIPALFDQLIIFITSGEREGFVNEFYSDHKNNTFLTIYKDRETKEVHLTNSVDFFKTFQSNGG